MAAACVRRGVDQPPAGFIVEMTDHSVPAQVASAVDPATLIDRSFSPCTPPASTRPLDQLASEF